MVYRVWAECISDVYVDIEAETEEEAKEAAEALDGSNFISDPTEGDFKIGTAYAVDEEPMFTYDEILYPEI